MAVPGVSDNGRPPLGTGLYQAPVHTGRRESLPSRISFRDEIGWRGRGDDFASPLARPDGGRDPAVRRGLPHGRTSSDQSAVVLVTCAQLENGNS